MENNQPETFTIQADYNYKVKLKHRLKLLFSGKMTIQLKLVVKEQPEVINNSCNLKF